MKKDFDDLVNLSKYLRGPDGCPWDKEQNLDTLKNHIVEEAYEVVQAIESNDKHEMLEELGDLLFQVIFASQIVSESGGFDVYDVVDQLYSKLVRRHPHVFGDEKVSDAGEAVKKWHTQKLREKSGEKKLVYIPKNMPSLLRAQRAGEKASQVGFDWKDVSDVLTKVREELGELEKEIKKGKEGMAEDEWGDLIFSLVNLARHLKIDAENSSHRAVDKFIDRFGKVEDEINKRGKKITDLGLKELDQIWDEVK